MSQQNVPRPSGEQPSPQKVPSPAVGQSAFSSPVGSPQKLMSPVPLRPPGYNLMPLMPGMHPNLQQHVMVPMAPYAMPPQRDMYKSAHSAFAATSPLACTYPVQNALSSPSPVAPVTPTPITPARGTKRSATSDSDREEDGKVKSPGASARSGDQKKKKKKEKKRKRKKVKSELADAEPAPEQPVVRGTGVGSSFKFPPAPDNAMPAAAPRLANEFDSPSNTPSSLPGSTPAGHSAMKHANAMDAVFQDLLVHAPCLTSKPAGVDGADTEEDDPVDLSSQLMVRNGDSYWVPRESCISAVSTFDGFQRPPIGIEYYGLYRDQTEERPFAAHIDLLKHAKSKGGGKGKGKARGKASRGKKRSTTRDSSNRPSKRRRSMVKTSEKDKFARLIKIPEVKLTKVPLAIEQLKEDTSEDQVPTMDAMNAWQSVINGVMVRAHTFATNYRTIREIHARLSAAVSRDFSRRAGRSFKGMKDIGIRAKRLTREMQMYWRRHEKDVAENRKRRQKELADERKREQEEREAERNRKKLEFLLTQTELYSHFIGSKMGLLPAGQQSKQQDPGAAGTGHEMGHTDPNSEDAMKANEQRQMRLEAERAAKDKIKARESKVKQFDAETKASMEGKSKKRAATAPSLPEGAEDDLDLLNPSTMPENAHLMQEPSLFNGKLKSYQLKGLNWLINLYEQGINGILADEMGLGKTIQSISFLSYLADVKDIWGPFVVICPNSTLHQWEQECKKFCPQLKVLPYWGGINDRKTIRKYWNPKLLYRKSSPFHILITSYQVVVNDEKYFQRLKWQYMVLDEAQAIKNSSSLRWQVLLKLRCRNRLLLTGTPIQNSMAELWALLHFIMPEFFDSHQEFNEWFSRDVQAQASGDKSGIDTTQIQRLHVILKPFMLRRVKRDVENEMAPKIEVQMDCPLSQRQKRLYKGLKNKLSSRDLFYDSKTESKSQETLMNLVMQFRKVCNHPELFQRRDVSFAFMFTNFNQRLPQNFAHHAILTPSTTNPIALYVPRLVANHRLDHVSYHPGNTLNARNFLLRNKLNIHHADYIHQSVSEHTPSVFDFTRFLDYSPQDIAFISSEARLLERWLLEIVRLHDMDRHAEFGQLCSNRVHLDRLHSRQSSRISLAIVPAAELNLRRVGAIPPRSYFTAPPGVCDAPADTFAARHRQEQQYLDDTYDEGDLTKRLRSFRPNQMHKQLRAERATWVSNALFANSHGHRTALVAQSPLSLMHSRHLSLSSVRFPLRQILATPPRMYASQWESVLDRDLLDDGWTKSIMQGFDCRRLAKHCSPPSQTLPGVWPSTQFVARPQGHMHDMDDAASLTLHPVQSTPRGVGVYPHCTPLSYLPAAFHPSLPSSAADTAPSSVNVIPGLASPYFDMFSSNTATVSVPNFGKLMADSGKLCTLDKLLRRLKRQGHRALIFSQMTKMIDILEDYMRYRKYKFFRLDGSTQLADRRDMVHAFQTNDEYFVFLLSTRAGGLGINLTSADTVIFYDNDWNPTMDAQAMDRVHRIGQTKQVTVYRLVCAGTVEERILKRAQYKFSIQKTVYSGGFKLQKSDANTQKSGAQDKGQPDLANIFQANELQDLLMDDSDREDEAPPPTSHSNGHTDAPPSDAEEIASVPRRSLLTGGRSLFGTRRRAGASPKKRGGASPHKLPPAPGQGSPSLKGAKQSAEAVQEPNVFSFNQTPQANGTAKNL